MWKPRPLWSLGASLPLLHQPAPNVSQDGAVRVHLHPFKIRFRARSESWQCATISGHVTLPNHHSGVVQPSTCTLAHEVQVCAPSLLL
ncbi:hypothetical protein PLICRDRAFT_47135 [Plicaturopsis crispa FD-325 SS-3]|uniref:Uncharacterized protein n=1 Tax=Plicaturopsis crispa FD-325 SS-3 TaxID=944288 RepID=A0A0C9SQE2_PLICR|nr:hypothetical protein PLICRDRAFT_47135 [Plicaturopsis crispa FD-325 SS-3]